MKTARKAIALIGSKEKCDVDASFDWGDKFYVGDYEALIIDTTSLDAENLDALFEKDQNYLYKLREHIVEAQQERGLEVYCIMTPPRIRTGYHLDDENYVNYGNYSWSPVVPVLERVAPSKKMAKDKASLFKGYLPFIKNWQLLYRNSFNHTGYVDRKDDIYTKIVFKSLLENYIGKTVAFSLGWMVCHRSDYYVQFQSKDPMIFLPEVEDKKGSLEAIIKHIRGKENPSIPVPDWVSSVSVAGEKECLTEIDRKEEAVREAQTNLDLKKSELRDLLYYKGLLYLYDKPLEEVVEKSFDLLGIKLHKLEVENKEDRLFKSKDATIPFEIRGKKRDLDEKDLNQLTGRLADQPESKQFKTRGVFVLNQYREVSPDEKGEAFTKNLVKKAEPWNVCLIDTKTLYELVNKKLLGQEINELETKLFNTVGIYRNEVKKTKS